MCFGWACVYFTQSLSAVLSQSSKLFPVFVPTSGPDVREKEMQLDSRCVSPGCRLCACGRQRTAHPASINRSYRVSCDRRLSSSIVRSTISVQTSRALRGIFCAGRADCTCEDFQVQNARSSRSEKSPLTPSAARANIPAEGGSSRRAGPCWHGGQDRCHCMELPAEPTARVLGVQTVSTTQNQTSASWMWNQLLLGAEPRERRSRRRHCSIPASVPPSGADLCSLSVPASPTQSWEFPHQLRLALSGVSQTRVRHLADPHHSQLLNLPHDVQNTSCLSATLTLTSVNTALISSTLAAFRFRKQLQQFPRVGASQAVGGGRTGATSSSVAAADPGCPVGAQ